MQTPQGRDGGQQNRAQTAGGQRRRAETAGGLRQLADGDGRQRWRTVTAGGRAETAAAKTEYPPRQSRQK